MNLLSDSWHVARIPHQCDYCGLWIEPGERYSYAFMTDGGDSWSWKSHRFCKEFGSQIFEREPCLRHEGLTQEAWLIALEDWLQDELGAEGAASARGARRQARAEERERFRKKG